MFITNKKKDLISEVVRLKVEFKVNVILPQYDISFNN